MRIDEIAQRFSRRRDFELVDFALVALPMYAITMECICSVHRPVPPISLFILRAIEAGLRTESRIGEFLGLDRRIVNVALGELIQDRYITESATGTEHVLSEIGSRIIQEEKEYVPQEETHTIIYDGILRRPIFLSGEQLLRPSELDRSTTIEIRPYPGILPELDEIRLPDVVHVLKSQYEGEDEFDRDVLALSRISRRSKVFRIGIGLAYKMIRGHEVQIAFIADGVPHRELERIFAEKGGARKMGFIKALGESGNDKSLRQHLGSEVLKVLPDDNTLQERRQSLATTKLALDIAVRRAEADPSLQNTTLLEGARRDYELSIREMRAFEARPLEVYEIADLLADCFATANKRILVGVSESWHIALNRQWLKAFEDALGRGVEIRVLEFSKAVDKSKPKKPEMQEEIAKLGMRFKIFSVTRSRRKGFFFLVKDREFAAVTNRPALGPASKSRMFHQFSGYLLQSPSLVEIYATRVTELYWNESKDK